MSYNGVLTHGRLPYDMEVYILKFNGEDHPYNVDGSINVHCCMKKVINELKVPRPFSLSKAFGIVYEPVNQDILFVQFDVKKLKKALVANGYEYNTVKYWRSNKCKKALMAM